jgi:hypothetical protein
VIHRNNLAGCRVDPRARQERLDVLPGRPGVRPEHLATVRDVLDEFRGDLKFRRTGSGIEPNDLAIFPLGLGVIPNGLPPCRVDLGI